MLPFVYEAFGKPRICEVNPPQSTSDTIEFRELTSMICLQED